jgi:hypothetical protein
MQDVNTVRIGNKFFVNVGQLKEAYFWNTVTNHIDIYCEVKTNFGNACYYAVYMQRESNLNCTTLYSEKCDIAQSQYKQII